MIEEAIKMLFSLDFWRMAVLWPISLIYSYSLLFLKEPMSFLITRHRAPNSCADRSVERLPGGEKPICIITGATSGLGAATAKLLAGKGYRVVLVGRSPRLLTKIVMEIREKIKDTDVEAFVVDLSSIRSIMKFKIGLGEWLSSSTSHFSIQLLINNAGILATTHRLTLDGYDEMMVANYLGAFCLTNFLLTLLKNSPVPSRIVNVTSFTHRCVWFSQGNESDILKNLYDSSSAPSSPSSTSSSLSSLSSSSSSSESYPFARLYEKSKFYMLLFTYELHRRLHVLNSSDMVSAIAADPGAVETRIMREFPGIISWFAFKALKFFKLLKNTENGARAIVDAALAPPEMSGVYFFGGQGRTIKSSPISYSEKLAEELWNISWELISETDAAVKAFLDRCRC